MWAEVHFSFELPDGYTVAEARQETFDEVAAAIRNYHLTAALIASTSGKPERKAITKHHKDWAERLKTYEIIIHEQ